jgi:hypothetical protein
MKSKTVNILLLLLFVQYAYTQESEQQANSFATKNSTETFIGNILYAKSINNDAHQFLNVKLHPITISFSSSLKSKEIIPSYDNMMEAIQDGLQGSDILKPNYDFSFSIKELKSFGALAIPFGQNINQDAYFAIPENKKLKKTVAVVNISQSYFTVDMDMQESLTDDPTVNELADELIYVNLIEFGRGAVVVVESASSYQELKGAIEDMLKNDPAQVSELSSSIIGNATIKCMTLGNEEVEITSIDNPFSDIINYMNQDVTANSFGTPISFSASHLKDSKMFVNTFMIDE